MNPRVHLPWRLEYMPGGDIAFLKGRRSRDLVIAFSCYQPDWNSMRTPVEFNFLNSVIQGRNDGIFIRDVQNGWYQFGVPDAKGSAYEVMRFLERHVRSYDRVVVIGSSMGGYAALLFGALLQVDRVVAIVPQVGIGTAAAQHLNDHRWAAEYNFIDTYAGHPELRRLDLFPLPLKTRFYAVYGDQDIYDNCHVKALEDTEVRVVLMEEQDHDGAARSALKSRILDLIV